MTNFKTPDENKIHKKNKEQLCVLRTDEFGKHFNYIFFDTVQEKIDYIKNHVDNEHVIGYMSEKTLEEKAKRSVQKLMEAL